MQPEEYSSGRRRTSEGRGFYALSYDRTALAVSAKHVVHPERSEKNGVATHPFRSEEASGDTATRLSENASPVTRVCHSRPDPHYRTDRMTTFMAASDNVG